MGFYEKIISESLRALADRIETEGCNLQHSDWKAVCETIEQFNAKRTYMSKYQACDYLHVSRSTFDRMVKDGRIPEGKPRQGFKELSWERKDLDKARALR